MKSAASIDYTCATCGKPVTVPHAAAWPSRCPHCGTAPPTLMVKVGGSIPLHGQAACWQFGCYAKGRWPNG